MTVIEAPEVKEVKNAINDPVTIKLTLTPAQADGQFVYLFERISTAVHDNNIDHGFWESENKGEKISLMHSEISEVLESERIGNPKDEKLPSFTQTEVELADAVIRIMDYSKHFKLNVAGALLEKHRYNLGRPYKHEKAF